MIRPFKSLSDKPPEECHLTIQSAAPGRSRTHDNLPESGEQRRERAVASLVSKLKIRDVNDIETCSPTALLGTCPLERT